LQHERLVLGLALLGELFAAPHLKLVRLHVRKALQLIGRQGNECAELPGQGALELHIGHRLASQVNWDSSARA